MEVNYIGHSAFYVKILDKAFLFDPWINGNPVAKISSEINPTHIFVSHGHKDHGLEDATKISNEKHVPLIGVFELVNVSGAKHILPGNIGGAIKDDEVEIYITAAQHSCPYGTPAGFIVKYADKTIYHAGDTGLFSDMKLLGELYEIDLAFLPIGGTFTMSPKEAVLAAKMLKAKTVIPMHYNTFPAIEQDPKELNIENKIILNPGEKIKL